MKWNNALILLSCGAVTGGVATPIFTTDILGYDRILEWFPADLKFDWGSFLGGTIAGVAAFGVFMLQRYVDRRVVMQRELSGLKVFCVRAKANIDQMLKDGTDSDIAMPADLQKNTGIPALAGLCVNAADDCGKLSTEVCRQFSRSIIVAVEFMIDQLQRLWEQTDRIYNAGSLTVKSAQLLEDIVQHEEKIRSLARAILVDASEERFLPAPVERRKVTLRGLPRLVDGLRELRKCVAELEQACK